MEEIFSPAHGITWALITSLAALVAWIIRGLDRSIKEQSRALTELALALKELSTLTKRGIDDIKDIAKEVDTLRETTSEHHAWAGAKAAAIDESINLLVQRVSRIEGKVFNGNSK